MLRAAVMLARAVGTVSRLTGRGGGTSLPGKLLLRLEPDAIDLLGAQLGLGSVVVSATNGKTTTTRMIASILREAGIETVHNRAGANMPGGVATALVGHARGGRIGGSRLGLFEVDEAWMGEVTSALSPQTVVLGNLFRDQLDRYGELEKLADEWAALVAGHRDTRFVLNADDPLVADLGRDAEGRAREGIVYFGVEDSSQALPQLEHAFDAKHCRRCGASYRYAAAYLGHLGDYACERCGNARPRPEIAATTVALAGMSGSRAAIATPMGAVEVSLPLPGLYNVYNALAATACCLQLGVSLDQIRRGLEASRAAFGRAERIQIGDRPFSILLIKNPAGANEVFRTLASGEAPTPNLPEVARNGGGLDLWIALNDRIADGRDVSWIWDADFEQLAGLAARIVCSGTRAEELALRLKYAGVDEGRLQLAPSLAAGLEASLERDGGRPIYALPTYTALLELTDLLAARGLVKPFWE
jgi:lipid II isoglutaminyl synthase (glutamine-hydrolysing)